MNAGSPVTSLYVHVPFCAHKCEYCAFYSHGADGEMVNRYVRALVREMDLVAGDLKPKTIFFGGGTPSLLNLRQWEEVLKAMEKNGLLGAAEWTVECNPATVSADKAKLLRAHGVNRISMGVQSLNEKLLDRLGRIHSREMVFKSFDILRQAGFDNVNLDLMFAIPGQTMEMWRESLAETMAMGCEHLSSYEVTYEEDTPLYEQLKAGEFDVDEDLACAMYEQWLEDTAAAGFQQYEISNLARKITGESNDVPTRACQHNLNYWRGGSFYGLGPSAAGFTHGKRTKNWSNTTLYCEQLEKGKRAVELSEELTPVKRAGEIAAFGLRMNRGWGFAEFQERTGFDLRTDWAAEMERLEKLAYAEKTDGGFKLTRTGLRYADWAAELFVRTE